MCSKVLNGHIILTDTSITTILAPEMTYTPCITYPLPARNALFRIKALVFQLVVPNSRMPNNLTKRLTHPTSSSYYATQHVQSPFLRKKAVGEIGPDSRHGRITINGTMSQFSCKLTVRSSFWDTKANKAAGKSLEAQRINRMSSSSAHLQV